MNNRVNNEPSLRHRYNLLVEEVRQVQADAKIATSSYQRVIQVMENQIAHLRREAERPRVGCIECDFTGLIDIGPVDVVLATGEVVERPYRVLCPNCRNGLNEFIDSYLSWLGGCLWR